MRNVAIAAAALGVLALLAGIMFTVQVDYDEVGLPATWGRLTGQTYEPGLRFRVPLVQKVWRVPVTIRSYETSSHPNESEADFTDHLITGQTSDGQQVEVKCTVLFHLEPDQALAAVRTTGLGEGGVLGGSRSLNAIVQNVVKANTRSLARTIIQQYTAEDLYSGAGIVEYADQVASELEAVFSEYHVTLDRFLVRKIDFDGEYVDAIEAQQIEEERIETEEYRAQAAEHEAARQAILASGQYSETVILAQADAEEIYLRFEAQARGIREVGNALYANPLAIEWQVAQALEGNIHWGILPSDVTPLMSLPSTARPPAAGGGDRTPNDE